MRNWKTTVFGVLVLATRIAAPLVPQYKEALDNTAEVLVGGGLVVAADGRRKSRRDGD